ncbi:MAG: hypothetical protein ACKO2G_01425 [Verrucomicrobiales bacterium]
MDTSTNLNPVLSPAPETLRPLAEAWVVSESPLWRTWVGSMLEGRGYLWRAVGWSALDQYAVAGESAEVVVTDGSRDLPPGVQARSIVEGGENLGDPWDANALERALESSGAAARNPLSAEAAAPMAEATGEPLGRWYLQAGRQALSDIEDNLRRFVDAQPSAIAGSDYLNEARESVRRMGDLQKNLATGMGPAPVAPGASSVWSSIEAAFDLAAVDGSLTWVDELPDVMPDVAMARWPMEKALEGLVLACRVAVSDNTSHPVVISARERAVAPWRQLELECRGLPGPDRVPELAEALLSLAARMSAAGGRFELAPSGDWRCVFPVKEDAVLRERRATPRLRRVLVVASDAIESPILCQMVWRKGMLPVPVSTVSRAAHYGSRAPAKRPFDAAILVDGPGVVPNENAIFLGLTMPIIVLSMSEGEGRRWLDVPGVSNVLASPASPSEAVKLLELALD